MTSEFIESFFKLSFGDIVILLLGMFFISGWFYKPLQSNVKNISSTLIKLIQNLVDKNIINPFVFFESNSPKRITEEGKKLLKEVKVKGFLYNCDLLQNRELFKGKKGADIYFECINWMKENENTKLVGKKIAEMMYISNISRENAFILLALAIHDEIQDKLKRLP